MHRFKYKKGGLHCEGVGLERIAQKVGTPFYCYSLESVREHYRRLRDAFKGIDCQICYSVKSNSNLTLMRQLVRMGAGLDIVSGGELYKGLKVGASPETIVYSSVGKTEAEIRAASSAGILMFNVESEEELEAINRVACHLGKVQPVALRVNPDVKASTHHYITTGTKENKFGISMDDAFRMFVESYRYPFLKFIGVHTHIGSQITEARPFVQTIRKISEFVTRLRRAGMFLEYFNIGGGLGIVYSKEKPQTAHAFAAAVRPLLQKMKLKVILEPGRFISGNSGILVTEVLYWKEARHKTFCIVDAGMNDLARPSIYGAHHEILPVRQRGSSGPAATHVDVVGPICESGDFLAKDRKLVRMRSGEFLAVMSCGAYGFTMASNYNSRPRIPEVVVRGQRFWVARRRETPEDLIRGEEILDV
ncbi:MAG: diaminopimelate decarboxylase [Candidatus Omnitrophica bacterium]|nr:diaminopimelate decarboxylase [Candidatus Omnitrophota bacterium]